MSSEKFFGIGERLYIDYSRMENYGRNCAAENLCGSSETALGRFLRMMKGKMSAVRSAACAAGSGEREPGAVLADNLYLLEETWDGIRSGLCGLKLPGRRGGFPAVFHLAVSFVKTGEENLTEYGMKLFLSGAEKERPLLFRESACFVTMMKCALLILCADVAECCVKFPKGCTDAEARLKRRIEFGTSAAATDELSAEHAEKLRSGLSESAAACIRMLRRLEDRQFSKAVRESSAEEKLLMSDPAGVYPESSDETKAHIRFLVEKEAKLSGRSEEDVIISALGRADREKGVIGAAFDFANIEKRRRFERFSYLLLENLLPLAAAVLTGVWAGWFPAAVSYLPWREICTAFLQQLYPRFVLPREICSLNLRGGVPESARTLCVVSLLADSAETVEKHMKKLERYMLSNRDCGGGVMFGLLMDLPDADAPSVPEDAAIISKAQAEAEKLNLRWGGKFCVIYRERVKSACEEKFIPWERKRGAIMALAALAAGEESSCEVRGTEREKLRGVRYILTLDADTEPYPGSVKKIVAAAAHPQNAPVIGSNGRVVSGYGIIKPRMSMELDWANRSLFSRIYAGQGGTDPYSSPSADPGWCMFGNSHFTGKGILDVRAVCRVLSGRLPDEKILSHDILEGGYLRCGYAAGAEFLDGFPSTVRGYAKRLGRWTRGDIQLIPWLFRTVRDRGGEKYPNPVDGVTRCEIFRNALRPLLPVCVFASFFLFVTGTPGFALPAAASLISLAAPLLINVFLRLTRPAHSAVRRHSEVYTGWRGGVMLMFSKIVFIPYEAWVSVRSAVTALWRMLFSKKRLLEWVTAAEGDRLSPKGPLKTYCAMLSCVLAGALAVLVGMDPASFAAAVIWGLAPLFASYLSVPLEKKTSVGKSEERLLWAHAEKMERYFSDIALSEYLLPPDNFQENPHAGWADRTSPTNIGLVLLAAAASAKMGLITGAEAARRCTALADRIAALEKYRGNLYNWYGCLTAKPLEPRYISSVDSGNFAACAAAAAQALRELGLPEAENAAQKLEALWRETDLSVFYDEKRKLMAIGLDGEKRRLGGFYDMLESEARLTSFVAIAKGDAPAEHWGALSRATAVYGGYGGLVSWSGSLFEYLMPEILMPVTENSLLAESGNFAVWCQKRYGERLGKPWGISESCYFAFDSSMNYQYKAFGAEPLALRRCDPEEYAVSPYSSYLALGHGVRRACGNLAELEAMGLGGIYGLCESADFTPGRIPAGERYMAVRTYMTHHIAMSLCSAANVLCEGFLTRCFMAVPEFSAFEQLLRERIPEMTPRMKSRRSLNEKGKERVKAPDMSFDFESGLPLPPSAVLSNYEMTVTASGSGRSRAEMRGISLYSGKTGFLTAAECMGKAFFVKPGEFPDSLERSFAVRSDRVEYRCAAGSAAVTETVSVSKSAPAERRVLEIETSVETEVAVALYLEPQMTGDGRFEAHPEFERLKICAAAGGNGRSVVFRRKNSSGEDGFMCVSASVPAESVCVSKSAALGRGGAGNPEIFFEKQSVCTKSDGDAAAKLVFRLKCSPGKKTKIVFAAPFESSEELAAAAAEKALGEERCGRAFVSAAAMCGLDRQSAREGLFLTTAVTEPGYAKRWIAPGRMLPKSELWKLKISGDLPIVSVATEKFVAESEFLGAVYRYLRLHRLLAGFGIRFDLVVLCDDRGSYERPSFNGVGLAVKLAGSEGLLNQKGGVHIIDRGSADGLAVSAVSTYACAGLPLENTKPVRSRARSRARTFADGALSKRIHSEPLANACFGCVMADVGPVLMYAVNSRMLKLIPWQNDPLAPKAEGMELSVVAGGVRRTTFAANDGRSSKVTFAPGVTVWESRFDKTEIRVSACVDSKLPVLNLSVEVSGEGASELLWMMRPMLCEHEADALFVRTSYDGGVFSAVNPVSEGKCGLFAAWNREPDGFTCDEASWRAGEFDGSCGEGLLPCFAARFRLEKGERLSLSVSTMRTAAEVGCAFPEECFLKTAEEFRRRGKALRIKTGEENLDRYMNVWSEYQIKASRLLARSSAFQNGGAYGFRDQLQDAAALLLTEPEILARQIYRSCAHQYEAGDVMHWYHTGTPEMRRGVRTRCSDDLLWLVRETCEYVEYTGDVSLLEKKIAFLDSPPLEENEPERYEPVKMTSLKETVFEHCVRAAECFIRRGFDQRGLPFLLHGDWNDGFSSLGDEGRGVSVWLAFFAADTLGRFSALCAMRGSPEQSSGYAEISKKLIAAAAEAWDGDRFIRAWSDDGTEIGSSRSPVVGLDSVAQSFAWFVPADDAGFAVKRSLALDTALKLLKDRESGVWKLFDRPVTDKSCGYIADYPAGVRENGGQYTHAAVWLAQACFRADRADAGAAILRDILSLQKSPAYGGEDFVIAADVSAKGKCGWSWYTGSAGWFRRAVLEDMLGLRMRAGILSVEPNIPESMDGYECDIRIRGALCRIRCRKTGVKSSASADVTKGGEFLLEVTV